MTQYLFINRKHVLQDLRPYVCTFEHCRNEDSTFARRRDWVDHEMREHQLSESFYRCLVPGCQAKFKDPESVFSHQKNRHYTNLETMRCGVSSDGVLCDYHSILTQGCDGSLWSFDRPCDKCAEAGGICGTEKLQLSQTRSFDRR